MKLTFFAKCCCISYLFQQSLTQIPLDKTAYSARKRFLVGGFVRLRADEVLSHTGKYPKGAGGGQRVHVCMAAPGPPVAKLQCTASLAGARLAGFTSVPGRAAVAFGAVDPLPRRLSAGLSLESWQGTVTVGMPWGNAALNSAPCTKNRVAGFAACNLIFCLFHTAAEFRPRTGSPAAFRESARGAFLRKAASRKPCCFR